MNRAHMVNHMRMRGCDELSKLVNLKVMYDFYIFHHVSICLMSFHFSSSPPLHILRLTHNLSVRRLQIKLGSLHAEAIPFCNRFDSLFLFGAMQTFEQKSRNKSRSASHYNLKNIENSWCHQAYSAKMRSSSTSWMRTDLLFTDGLRQRLALHGTDASVLQAGVASK